MTGQSTPMVGLIRHASGVMRLCRGQCFVGLARSHLCSDRAKLGSILSWNADVESNEPGISLSLSVPGHIAAVLVGFAWHG
jgi:hypothetical protein